MYVRRVQLRIKHVVIGARSVVSALINSCGNFHYGRLNIRLPSLSGFLIRGLEYFWPLSCGIPLALLSVTVSAADADDTGLFRKQILDWRTAQISSVSSVVSPNPRIESIDGRSCVVSSLINVDVADEYAFDIDEIVAVTIEFDLEGSGRDIVVRYDKNGEFAGVKRLRLPAREESRWYSHSFYFERARFSGKHIGSEIGAIGNLINGDFYLESDREMVVCDIKLVRNYTTPQDTAFGYLALDLIDEHGNFAPGRVGIYNASGRMPLPSLEALPITYATGVSRVVTLNSASITWPESNRQAFYVDGSYRARLPVGHYDIVAARGHEYGIVQDEFVVEAEKKTSLTISIPRWENMAARGWYSGDAHIHVNRQQDEDHAIFRTVSSAENLNVSNLLPVDPEITFDGDGTYLGKYSNSQNSWGPKSRFGDAPFTLVTGQESPATLRGHVLMLNIPQPILSGDQYFLYHELFEESHKQGGLNGYAHAFDSAFWSSVTGAGMALDVPYGLVDFVEILQLGSANLEIWFDFLNLGYKIAPVAGTDFPVLDVPGAVRNYVHVGESFSTQGWFDGLKAGRTFVTNGPMLEFNINGAGMGSEIHVGPGTYLTIEASAKIGADFAPLQSIQLFRQGRLIAEGSANNGTTKLSLRQNIAAERGGWFVLKAQGEKVGSTEKVVAVSAPIYVYSGISGFCNPVEIPTIVARLRKRLSEMLARPYDDNHWHDNLVALQERVKDVNRKYDNLISLALQQRCIGGYMGTLD